MTGVPKADVRHLAHAAAAAALEAVALVLVASGGGLFYGCLFHAGAVLAIASCPAPRSRRWLAVTAIALLPGAGVAVAEVALWTRGRSGARALLRRPATHRKTWPAALARDLAEGLSPADALAVGTDEQRRIALATLVTRADREAKALLRWAISSAGSEVAMAAALALDEIEERVEKKARHGAA